VAADARVHHTRHRHRSLPPPPRRRLPAAPRLLLSVGSARDDRGRRGRRRQWRAKGGWQLVGGCKDLHGRHGHRQLVNPSAREYRLAFHEVHIFSHDRVASHPQKCMGVVKICWERESFSWCCAGRGAGDCARWWEAIQIEPTSNDGRAGLHFESAEL